MSSTCDQKRMWVEAFRLAREPRQSSIRYLVKGRSHFSKKPRPADALDPVRHALPRARVVLVGVEDLLHHRRHLRPARRVVRQARGHHLHEGRLAARVGVLAADPDRQLGVLGVVDLHRRAGRVAGAAAHALLLVDFQRGLAVDHRRADGGHRAARHHGRALAGVGHQVVVDLRRLGVLHDDGDVGLAAAVDLAAARWTGARGSACPP